MPEFSITSLSTELDALLPLGFSGKICVAFSGGLDSTALLHAIAELCRAHPGWQVRAIHVDHQLQAASGDWAAQCKRIASTLDISCLVERVTVASGDQGPEAAARSARYALFRRELYDGEALLTAHHADDQAETLLLALLRGSGVRGLAAMPSSKPFARGVHIRPLLQFTRQDLEAWVNARQIAAIHDPTNKLLRHDRNFLRHEVIPLLRQRWPAIVENFGRTASHLSETLELLDELAVADLSACAAGRCLRIQALGLLSAHRRRNVLRYWLRQRGLLLPSTRKLLGLERDLSHAAPDRAPCIRWRGAEVHWYRGLLYAEPAFDKSTVKNVELTWSRSNPLELPEQLGSLSLMPSTDGLSVTRLPEHLTVRFRTGGETIVLPGRKHRHALRNLLQENDVLPWWRDRLPLIYSGNQLVGVANLYFAAEFAAEKGEPALQLGWHRAPNWRAQQT